MAGVICELWVDTEGNEITIPYQRPNAILYNYKTSLSIRGYKHIKDTIRSRNGNRQ